MDVIQRLIEDGRRVIDVKIKRDEIRLDVGAPESWLDDFGSVTKAINLRS